MTVVIAAPAISTAAIVGYGGASLIASGIAIYLRNNPAELAKGEKLIHEGLSHLVDPKAWEKGWEDSMKAVNLAMPLVRSFLISGNPTISHLAEAQIREVVEPLIYSAYGPGGGNKNGSSGSPFQKLVVAAVVGVAGKVAYDQLTTPS
jgi:hypothetical protein